MFIKRKRWKSGDLEHPEVSQIQDIMRLLAGEFPEYGKLPIDRRIALAISWLNVDKTRIYTLRFYLDQISHVIPWIITLAALLWRK